LIAIDTSSLSAFLKGEEGGDVALLEEALADRQACLPPVVLTELLSDPKLSEHVRALFQQLPLLSIREGYWERAGALRAKVLERGRKAKLADTLIAQSCLDHNVPLISRDPDFRNFIEASGLKLLAGGSSPPGASAPG
jgi:predicted nucleic acid-binding protein